MAKSQTTSYVLTLPVAFDTANQPAVLVKESRKAASIYNACLNESLKRLHKLQHDRHYLAHTNNALNGINSETCYNDFNNFYELEKAEINRLRNTHTLDWYTA